MRDLKLAVRTFRKAPAFSALVVGMLALGIAGNAAIFSLFNSLFLRPLPFADPARLVGLDETAPQWNLKFVGINNPDFDAWHTGNRTFDRIAVYRNGTSNLSGLGAAQRLRHAQVSYEMLDVLGLKPALGRNFLPSEDRPGAAKVVMIGHGLWTRLFNRDQAICGRIVRLDEQPYVIVGVLPPEALLEFAELWMPLAADLTRNNGYYLAGIGRLKPGVTIDQAKADLLRVHRSLIAVNKTNAITSPAVIALRDRYLGDYRMVTRLLLSGVAVVLLIACVNVAALTLMRGSARARELAIRTAIGASRSAIVRQLLAESLILAAAGGAIGVALGGMLLRVLISLMPEDTLPRWVSYGLDARFALFCVLVTGSAALLFGVAPAWQAAGVDARSCLQEAGARTSLSRGRRHILSGLVVCEIGLALMLLISAGLLVEAFRKVTRVDPGFRPAGVISYTISLPGTHYQKAQQLTFYRDLLRDLRAIPGVKAAGAASAPPLGGHWGNFFKAEGAAPRGPQEQDPVVLQVAATPGYFDAIGMTFVAGRPFNDRDEEKDAPQVAIVNESFAKLFWPRGNPLGRRVAWRGDKTPWMEVVGVVKDTRHYGLDRDVRPGIFLPDREAPFPSMSIVLRSAADPRALIAPAQEILHRMDADLPMFDIRTMNERLDRSLWARRGYSWLFAAFAAVALLLSAAGVYGVISYAVAQRTQEIGIRMALGAAPRQVLQSVLASGLKLAVMGIALGLTATWWAGNLLNSLLFGVNSRDPWTYAAVVLGVVLVALAANLIPARRAAAVDPMRALRF